MRNVFGFSLSVMRLIAPVSHFHGSPFNVWLQILIRVLLLSYGIVCVKAGGNGGS